jgi:chromosome segregation ATPase
LGQRLDALAQAVNDQLGKLVVTIHSQAIELREYVTVTRRHVANQESVNDRVQKALDGHDQRLHALETDAKVLRAKLPDRLLPAGDIEAKLAEQSSQVKEQRDEVDARLANTWGKIEEQGKAINEIRTTLGRYAAIFSVVFMALNWGGPLVFKLVAAKLFGGTP